MDNKKSSPSPLRVVYREGSRWWWVWRGHISGYGDDSTSNIVGVFGGESSDEGGGGNAKWDRCSGMGMGREGCLGRWFAVLVMVVMILFQPIEPSTLQILTITKESLAQTNTPILMKKSNSIIWSKPKAVITPYHCNFPPMPLASTPPLVLLHFIPQHLLSLFFACFSVVESGSTPSCRPARLGCPWAWWFTEGRGRALHWDQERLWQRWCWGCVTICRGRGRHWRCFWGRGQRPGCSRFPCKTVWVGMLQPCYVGSGNCGDNTVSITSANICGIQLAHVVQMTQAFVQLPCCKQHLHLPCILALGPNQLFEQIYPDYLLFKCSWIMQ